MNDVLETELRSELRVLGSALPAGEPDLAHILIAGGRLRRRRRSGIGAGAAIACLAAVLTVATVTPRATVRQPASITTAIEPTPSYPPGAPTDAEVDQALQAHYLYVSGVELAGDYAHGLQAYSAAIQDKLAPDCTHAPTTPGEFADFPDLAAIRLYGLDRLESLPRDKPCGTELKVADAVDPIGPLAEAEAALQRSWNLTLNPGGAFVEDAKSPMFDAGLAANSDPAVAAAYAKLPACIHTHGYAASSEEGLKLLSDNLPGPAGSPAALAIGATYADCMQPILDVRQPILLAERAEFLKTHAADWAAFLATADTLVDDTVMATGVSWPGH